MRNCVLGTPTESTVALERTRGQTMGETSNPLNRLLARGAQPSILPTLRGASRVSVWPAARGAEAANLRRLTLFTLAAILLSAFFIPDSVATAAGGTGAPTSAEVQAGTAAAGVMRHAGSTGSGLIPRWVPGKPAQSAWREGWYPDLLVLKLAEGSGVRLRQGQLVSLNGTPLHDLQEVLAEFGNPETRRLFTRPETTLEQERRQGEAWSGRELADLNLYFALLLSPEIDAEELVDKLNALEVVERCYFEPIPRSGEIHPVSSGQVAGAAAAGDHLDPRSGARTPEGDALGQQPGSKTPDFESMQKYLEDAPAGLGIRAAWAYPGALGAGIRFADIERGWNGLHEDLVPPMVWYGEMINTDHGTAVLGLVLGAHNGLGISGAAPAVELGVASIETDPPFPVIADAINRLMDFLRPGDVLLLEHHALGPPSGEECACSCYSFEFVPLEYWQANFDAIAAATANGVVVVAIAGNGSMDLDHPRYQGVFNRWLRDSGALIVGASAPLSRIPTCWTNHGSRLDLHGHGLWVTTSGYGFLYNGGPNATYTYGFGGTSAAGAMVAGCCCSLQGYWKMRTGEPLSPLLLRERLVETGTPQAADPWRIGPRPDLERAIGGEP